MVSSRKIQIPRPMRKLPYGAPHTHKRPSSSRGTGLRLVNIMDKATAENICPEGEKEYRCTWQHNLYPAGTRQLGLYQNIKAGCREVCGGTLPEK